MTMQKNTIYQKPCHSLQWYECLFSFGNNLWQAMLVFILKSYYFNRELCHFQNKWPPSILDTTHVVYFDQWMGAALFIGWSNYCFFAISSFFVLLFQPFPSFRFVKQYWEICNTWKKSTQLKELELQLIWFKYL